ncbi:hypothetical protein FB474_0522 [Oryzihumus leptocrescens]|uniref:Uncharacterized protein n=2 Tax=Oryzihumus leptocrescens TaxID=297536 RepID=A0A542ZFR4_9MICO|nr:hypothetical protein FB474_0522 [Oryzihumus leptocrescens]
MDQSHDGTEPVEAGDPTQALPSTGEPQDAPSAPVGEDTQRYAESVTPAAAATPAVAPAAPAVTSPERPRGPHAAAILLGVFAIAVAALAILRETTDLTVSWSQLGPGSVIVAGLLLLLIGVVGLTRRERGREH